MNNPMKTKLIALALFGLTGVAVLYYPTLRSAEPEPRPLPIVQDPIALPNAGQHPVIEAVFVLDTTGSMGGLSSRPRRTRSGRSPRPWRPGSPRRRSAWGWSPIVIAAMTM